MQNFESLSLDKERALYGLRGARVARCLFAGPEDGESALKECADLQVENCDFRLRYPLWHAKNATVKNCRMTDTCRAAAWYCDHISFENCALGGIKAVRECKNVSLAGGGAESTEFGWMCANLDIRDFSLASEYPFFHSSDINAENLRLKGKYSFQYVKNAVIRASVLDTKDAFWHARNVRVEDSVIKGEYLAWFSQNLTLVRCKIIGTQPLCYCEGLVLEDCEMENCDLAFENSDVRATIKGRVDSVKNPVSGFIRAGEIGEVILDEYLRPGARCDISSDTLAISP